MFALRSSLGYAKFERVRFIVDSTQSFVDDLRDFAGTKEEITVNHAISPLQGFKARQPGSLTHSPRHRTDLVVTPLQLAASRGQDKVVAVLLSVLHRDEACLSSALFLALFYGHVGTAKLLLDHGAHPSRQWAFSGLHGAAKQGLRHVMQQFVEDFGVDPDVKDGHGATPITYALLIHDEDKAWETICFLFYLKAKKDTMFRVGSNCWTYADLARSMNKKKLPTLLEDAADDASSRTVDFE
ncbi:Ankyrin repeat PH and SEC7 domain containing secG [Fusarium albosuccineum]|uniref:Ankyrin repeat PH and SEC7 domain containing secG n=1 Tax=Fusarium albosuccineum TaxID=1237068 RepID=A0A8H4L3E9_9HYPO|nr:Ankyrin repeat PH and SEC7 domain containing secG [Fusarium albosuccineum]